MDNANLPYPGERQQERLKNRTAQPFRDSPRLGFLSFSCFLALSWWAIQGDPK